MSDQPDMFFKVVSEEVLTSVFAWRQQSASGKVRKARWAALWNEYRAEMTERGLRQAARPTTQGP